VKSQQPKAPSAAQGDAQVAVVNKRTHKEEKKSSFKAAEPSGKLGKVVALLKRPKGATVADLMKATGWQAHSVRGVISGAIKRKLKLTVVSEKLGDVRSYRIKA
jgi:hypothetical protein